MSSTHICMSVSPNTQGKCGKQNSARNRCMHASTMSNLWWTIIVKFDGAFEKISGRKKIKISIWMSSDITLYTTVDYKCVLFEHKKQLTLHNSWMLLLIFVWYSVSLDVLGSKLDPLVKYWMSVFTTKTYLYNFDPRKPHFYIVKLRFTGVYIIFLISAQKHRLWVLVRTASSSSNEYQQSMF